MDEIARSTGNEASAADHTGGATGPLGGPGRHAGEMPLAAWFRTENSSTIEPEDSLDKYEAVELPDRDTPVWEYVPGWFVGISTLRALTLADAKLKA